MHSQCTEHGIWLDYRIKCYRESISCVFYSTINLLVLGAHLKWYSQKRQIIHASYCQMATLMMKVLELLLLTIKKPHNTVSRWISSEIKILHQLKQDNFFPPVKIIHWTWWSLRAPSNSKYSVKNLFTKCSSAWYRFTYVKVQNLKLVGFYSLSQQCMTAWLCESNTTEENCGEKTPKIPKSHKTKETFLFFLLCKSNIVLEYLLIDISYIYSSLYTFFISFCQH